MDLKTFFENFDEIAQAPGGVKRLRELILRLAYSGKLTQRHPKDSGESNFSDQIIEEKEKLLKETRFRSPRILRGVVEDEEKLFNIPNHWEWIRIGHAFPISSGTTPSRSKPEYFREATEYWVKTTDLNNGLVQTCEERITESAVQECNLKKYPIGTVCVALYGGGGTIGKSGILGIETTINQSVCGIYPNKYIDPHYFHGYLKLIRPLWMQFAASLRKAPNINAGVVNNMVLPVPPLAEQKRIVAKVDELMALCDEVEAAQQSRDSLQKKLRASALDALMNAPTDEALRTAWAFIREQWDELSQRSEDVEGLRQTVLQMGIKGKLVSQDSNDEAASKLVSLAIAEKNILVEAKKIKKRKPQAELEPEEIPFDMPQNWSCSRLGDILDIASGVTKGRKLAGRETESYPYLRVANVQRGSLNLSVMKEIEIPVEELDKYRLQKGDVLLTEGGDWDKLGRSAIWQGQIEDCIHQNHVFRARILAATLLPEWVSMFTNSAVGRRYFESAAKRTTNLASINMTQLRFCPFPVPPLAEQKRIVAKVEQLMTLCDSLQTHLHQRQQTAQALAQSLTQLSH